ncbi:Na(+)/H(+) exchange regulatory cofactor NHE-RF2 [Daktulosphaira vitifoliae]|uniref:Na(+)/H(+) exchange regulatory cofactor NHE-RF2 n=1 Tax=Daktulosphaira vitifoliae TaxID=58002 RepID=UPI0021AA407D|nr:Na(+)/H(+) exchange regulatory cofactor NHE-RF2 [Daktulosphaira vitifoliae]
MSDIIQDNNDVEPTIRLCKLRTWPNSFDGYGFNLHAEKAKTVNGANGTSSKVPGQYVGKVDSGSPAEAAGLREGDRIVEVDGHNIEGETHSQVVERIRKGSEGLGKTTELLVLDKRADQYYRDKNMQVTYESMQHAIIVLETPEHCPDEIDEKNVDKNGTVSPNQTGERLNLNMTAAELRKQLAERKLANRKGAQSLDLRTKYEIVDKL